MGTKHPDQVAPSEWRRAANTVGDMYRKRWEITARCRACDLVMLVDLRVVIAMKRPDFVLWNRKTPCRRLVYAGRCRGFVDFEFKAPGMTQPRKLAAPDQMAEGPRGHVERAFHEERQRQALDGRGSLVRHGEQR